jgi:hypothetical protein
MASPSKLPSSPPRCTLGSAVVLLRSRATVLVQSTAASTRGRRRQQRQRASCPDYSNHIAAADGDIITVENSPASPGGGTICAYLGEPPIVEVATAPPGATLADITACLKPASALIVLTGLRAATSQQQQLEGQDRTGGLALAARRMRELLLRPRSERKLHPASQSGLQLHLYCRCVTRHDMQCKWRLGHTLWGISRAASVRRAAPRHHH